MKVIFAKFPTSKFSKWLLWLIICLLLVGTLVFFRPGKASITKEEVLQAVYNTGQSQNFHWHIVTEIEFKGVHNILSDIDGDKNEDAFRIKGNFLKTPLEIIKIENMTYRMDSITKQWLVIKNKDTATEEVLTTELNPLAALNFAAINDFNTEGIKIQDKSETFKIELVPQVASPYLTKYWQEFQYTLLVDKDKKYLQGYQLTAKSKNDPTGIIQMKVDFSGFEKKISITPPI